MKERSLFIQKFEHIAREDPRVLSAFLGGSLADGTEDDFSDIDIYYILEEQSYSDFTSQTRTRLAEMGPLVFLEHHNNFGFDLILFIFQNGVKGELGLGTTKNLKTLHAGPYKVLIDKKHLLDGFVFPFNHRLKERISKNTSKNSFDGIGTGTPSSSPLSHERDSGQRSPNSSR